MTRRYTTSKHRHLTYGEIGKKLGISKCRVQQLEVRALCKLKRSPILKAIAQELGLAN